MNVANDRQSIRTNENTSSKIPKYRTPYSISQVTNDISNKVKLSPKIFLDNPQYRDFQLPDVQGGMTQ